MSEENKSVDRPKSVPMTAKAVRTRQMVLLGILMAIIIGVVFFGMKSAEQQTSDNPPVAKQAATPTNINAPGSQLDNKDAWMGQASAQLKGIEKQNSDLADRLKVFEKMAAGSSQPSGNPHPDLIKFPPGNPPAPTAVIAAPAPPAVKPKPLLPGAPPLAAENPLPQPNSTSFLPAQERVVEKPPGIVHLTFNTVATPSSSKPQLPGSSGEEKAASKPKKTLDNYLPPGFAHAVLLGGLDAPTGGQAQSNPQPVILQIKNNAILPNKYRAQVKDAFVIGSGFGDISSERAYIRAESLSMVMRDGSIIDVEIKGSVFGSDGKAGVRGRLVTKQGQMLANALTAGIASGIGSAFQQGATTQSVSPLGTTSTVQPGKQFEAGLGTGVGKAMDRLASYYISLAEKSFPIVEVDAMLEVDIVFTKGVFIDWPDRDPASSSVDQSFARGRQSSERWYD